MKLINKLNHSDFSKWQKWMLLSVIAFLGQCIWLFISYKKFRIGFPLDDAWIHQTYARNFVESFRWEYNSGIVSGGSTSPLWTTLLMPGYFIKSSFYFIWTTVLSLGLLVSSAFLFNEILNLIIKNKNGFPAFGILFIFEWHLFWATNSGMETILFVCMTLLSIYWMCIGKMYSIANSVLLGLFLWVRPDAISFVVIYLIVFFYEYFEKKVTFMKLIQLIIILTISVILYMSFNKIVAGSLFPNTFYAKQAEYAILYQIPLLKRILSILLIPITGVGVILIPGFLISVYKVIRNRDFKLMAILIWFFGYIYLFALRLPVTYQHGRYFIPLIPIYLLFGFLGYMEFRKFRINKWSGFITKTWELSAILILIIFWGLGAKAYSEDVAIIESELVDTAKWINDNTKETAVLAAHDIGALGYFTDRNIVDLAGLISPEVIPFIDNENKLKSYLDQQETDYLLVFPGWYKYLTNGKEVIYYSEENFSIDAGGEKMTVYKWGN